jgi:hypothetical protein
MAANFAGRLAASAQPIWIAVRARFVDGLAEVRILGDRIVDLWETARPMIEEARRLPRPQTIEPFSL